MEGHESTVRLLAAELGADPRAANKQGLTPAALALEAGHPGAASALEELLRPAPGLA
jgi:hypothetical protein